MRILLICVLGLMIGSNAFAWRFRTAFFSCEDAVTRGGSAISPAYFGKSVTYEDMQKRIKAQEIVDDARQYLYGSHASCEKEFRILNARVDRIEQAEKKAQAEREAKHPYVPHYFYMKTIHGGYCTDDEIANECQTYVLSSSCACPSLY